MIHPRILMVSYAYIERNCVELFFKVNHLTQLLFWRTNFKISEAERPV